MKREIIMCGITGFLSGGKSEKKETALKSMNLQIDVYKRQMYDDSDVDTARITVIATGLDDATSKQPSVGGKSMFSMPKSEPKQEIPSFKQAQGFTMPKLQMPSQASACLLYTSRCV